jgi:hypothetical protein
MNPDLFRQFMLSAANPEQRDQLRERLIADQDLSDQLRDQETDWIDAYAAGKLPAADARALYEHLQQTGQLHRLPTAAALAKTKSQPASVFPHALGLAATLLVVFSVVFQRPHTPKAEPPPAIRQALVPGTLRDGRAPQSVTAKPNQDVVLQLQYQDTAPRGECQVEIAGQPFGEDGPCGLDFHAYTLPPDLAPGRYTLRLTTAKGELIHTYEFTLIR